MAISLTLADGHVTIPGWSLRGCSGSSWYLVRSSWKHSIEDLLPVRSKVICLSMEWYSITRSRRADCVELKPESGWLLVRWVKSGSWQASTYTVKWASMESLNYR